MENRKFRKWTISSGISLIEILVVVTIFAFLGVIISSSIILTLQGSKKSESVVTVRENLDYSMSIIERQIRNANSITDCSTNLINYVDQFGKASSFSLTNFAVASGSANLTSSAVKITNNSSFSCYLAAPNAQPYIDIVLTAQSATLTGAQASEVTTNTRIYLRTY
jgi:Tfp pilus assembly protein PilE